MRDDKNLLLESEIIEVEMPENNAAQPEENDNYIEILAEQEQVPERPYRCLQNCNSATVALWICVLYNLCMVLLLIFVFVYHRRN